MMYARPEIFTLWAKNILRLQKDYQDIDVVVVGSEGQRSRKLVEGFGFRYFEFPNAPLGAKAHERYRRMKQIDPDYYCFTGSDDLISSRTFLNIRAFMELGFDEISTMTMYYYDTVTKKLVHSKGYDGTPRQGEPLAPYRCISRDLANRMPSPWDQHKPKYIDAAAYKNMKIHRKNYVYHSGGMIIDIKNHISLTPMQAVISKQSTTHHTRDILFDHFPVSEVEALFSL